MDKDPRIFLEHILESVNWIQSYVLGFSKDDFFSSVEKQDAVLRRLEIIGEAVKNLPDSFKGVHVDIPWRRIAGMRDVLIHEYFEVDLRLVWRTVTDVLPEFKKQIQNLLK
jgi:uncharacterized protein with HEPN domain